MEDLVPEPYRKGFKISHRNTFKIKSAVFYKDWDVCGSWIRFEIHEKNSQGYFDWFKHSTLGIALPENKGKNSWRIIYWNRGEELWVLRWTLPKFNK